MRLPRWLRQKLSALVVSKLESYTDIRSFLGETWRHSQQFNENLIVIFLSVDILINSIFIITMGNTSSIREVQQEHIQLSVLKTSPASFWWQFREKTFLHLFTPLKEKKWMFQELIFQRMEKSYKRQERRRRRKQFKLLRFFYFWLLFIFGPFKIMVVFESHPMKQVFEKPLYVFIIRVLVELKCTNIIKESLKFFRHVLT